MKLIINSQVHKAGGRSENSIEGSLRRALTGIHRTEIKLESPHESLFPDGNVIGNKEPMFNDGKARTVCSHFSACALPTTAGTRAASRHTSESSIRFEHL